MPAQEPELLTMTDLMARQYADTPALVGPDLIVQGTVNVLGGHPKSGKSWLALNLALAVASGADWLGFPTVPSRVLVLQSEIPERQLQKRVRMLTPERFGAAAERLAFCTFRGLALDQPSGIRVCREMIDAFRPDLFLIDPMARFFSGDENETRDMNRFIGGLGSLIQTYGLAILVVHHLAKPSDNGRSGAQTLRGSGALFAAVDAAMIFTKRREDWSLSFELRHAEEPATLTLTRSPSLWYSVASVPVKVAPVLAIVQRSPITWLDLRATVMTDLKVSQATAERRIREATEAGVIELKGVHYVAPRQKAGHQEPSNGVMDNLSAESERVIPPIPQNGHHSSPNRHHHTSPPVRRGMEMMVGGEGENGDVPLALPRPPRRVFKPWYEEQEENGHP